MPHWPPSPKVRPQSLNALQGISGLGARKLEAYGEAVLAVMAEV